MPEQAKLEELKENLDAAVESCDRSRYVLVLIVIASILCFSAFWNSLGGNWLDSRRVLVQAATKYWGWNDEVRKTLSPEEQELFDSSKKLFSVRWEKDAVQAYLNALITLRAEEKLIIHIPILGISFDINDLGLIGGISFLVLLVWLRFSLLRELNNLRFVFKLAETKGLLPDCYHVLAMHQVLTIPPLTNHQPKRFLSKIPKALFTLPFLIQALVFSHDWMTFSTGWSLNPSRTILSQLLSWTWLVLIAILTAVSLRDSNETDKLWRSMANEVGGRAK